MFLRWNECYVCIMGLIAIIYKTIVIIVILYNNYYYT